MTLLTGISLKLPVFIDLRKTKHLRSFQNSANNWFTDVFSFLLHKGTTEKSSQMPFTVITGRTVAKIEKSRTHRAIDYQQVTERLLMQVFANRFFFSIY